MVQYDQSTPEKELQSRIIGGPDFTESRYVLLFRDGAAGMVVYPESWRTIADGV